jgi:hypothetical protein
MAMTEEAQDLSKKTTLSDILIGKEAQLIKKKNKFIRTLGKNNYGYNGLLDGFRERELSRLRGTL